MRAIPIILAAVAPMLAFGVGLGAASPAAAHSTEYGWHRPYHHHHWQRPHYYQGHYNPPPRPYYPPRPHYYRSW